MATLEEQNLRFQLQKLRAEVSELTKDNDKFRRKAEKYDQACLIMVVGLNAALKGDLDNEISKLFVQLWDLKTKVGELEELRPAANAWNYLHDGIQALQDADKVETDDKLNSYIEVWSRQQVALRSMEDQLTAARDWFTAFKSLIHSRLDEMGIAHYPGKTCDISERLDEVQRRLTSAKQDAEP